MAGTILTLIDSEVRAKAAEASGPDPFTEEISGTPGVDSDGTVVVIGGRVAGGDGGNLTRPSGSPCPCPRLHGHGGVGVKATTIYATPNALFGGVGGLVSLFDPTNQRWAPYGRQNDGAPASSPVRTIRDDLTRGSPLTGGGGWTIRFPSVCQGGLLAIGVPASLPISFGQDLLFVDPNGPIASIALPPCATSFATRVPNSSALAGVSIAAQILELGTLRLSTPVIGTVVSFR